MPKRDVWVLPGLRPQAVGPFLAALAPHFALAAGLDLRLRPHARGGLVVLLPRPEGAPAAELDALRGRLAEAFEAAGRRAAEIENLPLQSLDIAAEPGLRDGILGHVWSLAGIPDTGPDPDGTALRAAVEEQVADADLPRSFAALVRRGRNARFLAAEGGAVLLDLEDDPVRGSGVGGLRAAGLPAGVTLLRRHALAAMSVWLPEDRGFAEGDRVAVSGLLNGLADAGLLGRGGEMHFLPGVAGAGRVLWLPGPEAGDPQAALILAEALALALDGPGLPDDTGPALRFTLVALRPAAEAQRDLNARLNDRHFPLGYRISLAPIRDLSRSEEDVERLRAEIEEREAQIALIQALGRPQLRLLRFTDAQLPALVDGLRRMPRALRENAGLRYAATHAAHRAEPAHYVLYDPEEVQFDGMLPEYYWRAATDDRPIAFWLDPHAEEARDGDPGEPLVFVPQGERILPYIDSFGGSLAGTLRLVLGGLFAEGAAVFDAPDASPAFVFSPLSGGGDEIAVELVDLEQFQPLRVSLRWINEHILAGSPRIADPEERRELAETLHAGQLARDMRKAMREEVEALKQDWRQGEAELLHCLDQLGEALSREVAAIQSQLVTARRFVEVSKARMAEVTQALNGLGAAVGGVDGALRDMAAEIPALAAERIAFFDRYQAEYEASTRLVEDTGREVARLRDRMQELAQELRSG